MAYRAITLKLTRDEAETILKKISSDLKLRELAFHLWLQLNSGQKKGKPS